MSAIDYRELAEGYASGRIDGWRKDRALAEKRIILASGAPSFATDRYFDANEIDRAFAADERLDTYLWQRRTSVFARHNWGWAPQYQWRGTCVGQGTKGAIEIIMASEEFHGRYLMPGRPCVSVCYAGGRVEIGKWVSPSDGSTGVDSAEFLTKYGVGLMRDVGLAEDDMKSDEQLAVKWAASNDGVPTPYELLAKTRPIKAWTFAKTRLQVGLAIQAGLAVTHCSNDWCAPDIGSDGIGRIQSHGGGHCQYWDGVRWDNRGEVSIVHNQGSWGPNYWQVPDTRKLVSDQPAGGCWENTEAIDRRLAEGEVIILSPVKGGDLPQLSYKDMF